ncbi:MAG: sulfatase-like hydrolase/transferase [Bacteroidetes bacterium]|nr:sulfatase-like hydrolase/transferase [Bacteroidota bacterium]
MSGFFEKISNRLLYSAQPFVVVNILASFLFAGVRIYELASVLQTIADASSPMGILLQSVISEMLFIFCCMFILSLLYQLLVMFLSTRIAITIHCVLLFLILAASFGLTQYFTITMIPLSTDLYGYSWDDIVETVSASGGITITTVLSLILLAAVVTSLPLLAKRLPTPKPFVQFFYAAALLAFPLQWLLAPEPSDFKREVEYSIVRNKMSHFVSASFSYVVRTTFTGTVQSDSDFPFLHTDPYPDVLGAFMEPSSERPNFVVIIVEGLGSSFVNGGSYQGFTPFLDSLAGQGLWWMNFLSTTGRTFGVLPSMTASLPFGEKGFMELGEKMPDHQSLFTLLQDQGYRSSFYYGSQSAFDKQRIFLERQQVKHIIDDRSFQPPYEKSPANEGGFSWGYADDDLFKRSLEELTTASSGSRLDVYLTISTHEPFIPPNAERYRRLFEERLSAMQLSVDENEDYRRFKDIFASLLYTDNALRNFFEAYRQRADYNRTIFIITGDHRLIPVPMATKIDRYRVPMIISSPMIDRPSVFQSVSTHADLVPTLLGFLRQNYSMKFPEQSHWIGSAFDTVREFRNVRSRAFMPFKGEISDYLDGQYFLSGSRLFKVTKGLSIDEMINDSVRTVLEAKRAAFIAANMYVVSNNKLYPSNVVGRGDAARASDDSLFARIDRLKLTSEQLFMRARDTAFRGYYDESRGICRRLLEINPEFHDVRTLMGRTYAWSKRYTEASDCFQEVICQAPNYGDAYFGMAQVEYWSGNFESVFKNIDRSLELEPQNIDARYLRALVMYEQGNVAASQQDLAVILQRVPDYASALELRKKINSVNQ